MNRRSFMASIAAAFAVGDVEVVLTKPPPLILTTGWLTVAAPRWSAGRVAWRAVTGRVPEAVRPEATLNTRPVYDCCDCHHGTRTYKIHV